MGAWAKDFDAEAVFANERSTVIAHLPSMEDEPPLGDQAAGVSGRSGAFFQLESVGGAKVDLEGARMYRRRRINGRLTVGIIMILMMDGHR